MLVRIVKMQFHEDQIDRFLNQFEEVKSDIREYPGCEFLELYQDKNQFNIFFTYSYWSSDDALQSYRSSPLFQKVWSKTKPLFSSKAEAWSVDKIVSLA